jgi:multiple sugar transport system permease protein
VAAVLPSKRGDRRLLTHALMAALALAWALPLLWMLSTSLKPEDQALSEAVGLLPELVNVDGEALSRWQPGYWKALASQVGQNYGDVWTSPVADFPRYLQNSLIVAFLSTLGMVVSSAVCAYGFARLEWPGRDLCFALVLGTMMIPFTVLMAPQYLLFKELGLIGTLVPLWLPSWFGGAFAIFLLRQFFMQLPKELDEAARLDGCGHFGIFWRVLLPNAKPALAAVGLLQFVTAWNDFVAPLIFLNHTEQFTLALGLQLYQSQHGGTPWTLLMAAAVLTVAPVLVIFALFQRAFVEGVSTQGLKG